jgi:nitrogen fixation protein NifX
MHIQRRLHGWRNRMWLMRKKKKEKEMKIGVVSTDGKNVNEHFGKAERFLIYEISATGLTRIMERRISRLSIGDKTHKFDAAHFDSVAQGLEGCEKVFCTRIGNQPRLELEKRGIIPVIYEGAIADIKIRES